MRGRLHERLGRLVAVFWVLVTCGGTAQADQSAPHNEAQRERWQKVDEIFAAMLIKPGASVADVGAGDGFFTSRLSAAVGDGGRVVAVDIGSDVLRRLRQRVADDGLANVTVVEGASDDPRLPAASLDAVLIVNAYHEMDDHQSMLTKIRAALKPGGRLVIVEPIASSRRDGRREDQTRNHEIAAGYVLGDTRAAGFTEVALQDPLTHRPTGDDDMWMLVVSPGPLTGSSPGPAAAAAPRFSSGDEDWKAPGLRISVEDFKRLVAAGEVLVLDVRDPESYSNGHLPGAVLMTAQELSTPEGMARLKGEARQIVAYCS